ncbi:unnamed protein product [Laminaria digitata]
MGRRGVVSHFRSQPEQRNTKHVSDIVSSILTRTCSGKDCRVPRASYVTQQSPSAKPILSLRNLCSATSASAPSRPSLGAKRAGYIGAMAFQQRRRRRTTTITSPFTRALGAACFAGATALSAAFIAPPGAAGGGFHHHRVSRVNHAVDAAGRVRRVCGGGGPSLRANRLAMGSALVESPPSLPPPMGAATTSGRRQRRRTPPLTVEEERALLTKIHAARLLRAMHKNLAAAGQGGGGLVNLNDWAREAGLGVEELTGALQGGLDAKRALVERNMPMVMQLIEQQYRWRLRGGQVSTADLLQEGAYALGLAADRFDPAMPNRFLTYALFFVRDKLDTALAGGNTAISVPVAALKELHRSRRELTAELGRSPSEAEAAHFFANGVVAGSPSAVAAATAAAAAAAAGSGGAQQAATTAEGRSGRVGEQAAAAAAAGAGVRGKTEVQPRIRERRLNLLSAVNKVRSIDTLIRDSEGNTMALVDTLVGHHGDPLRMPGNGDMSELLPKVLTREQASLVRMACGLEDGPPLSMKECSKRLSLSVGRTKTLLENSLEKLRKAATADNPALIMYK